MEHSAGTGILSFIRSVAHTIHTDLTETLDERTSRVEQEARLTNLEGEVPGNSHHAQEGTIGKVSALSCGYFRNVHLNELTSHFQVRV